MTDPSIVAIAGGARASSWLQPHRIGMAAVGLALVLCAVQFLHWEWLPKYSGLLIEGVWCTLLLLTTTCTLGFLLAVPIGLVQVTGPSWLSWPAYWFCTTIRGTPLLLQLWFLYYGLGSLFPQFPWVRDSFLWPLLRQAWPYAVLSLTISYAAYEGEVMRGAFASTGAGQLEAARAFGMTRLNVFRRIWLPQATYRALPTLAGETVMQLKATPLVATITVIDVYAVSSRIRQTTFIVYEPLLLLAVVYLCITSIIVFGFRTLERRIPFRLG